MTCIRKVGIWSLWCFLGGALHGSWEAAYAVPFSFSGLKVVWDGGHSLSEAYSAFSLDELRGLKKVEMNERLTSLKTSKAVKWRGILISDLINRLLSTLPDDSQALVDLMVLKARNGQVAFIPRAFLNKYPVLLGTRQAGEAVGSSWTLILPWSTHPKIAKEDLPLNSYLVEDVVQIELSSYKNRFQSLRLRRRTDPSAVRGEKLFIQRCVQCHDPENHPPLQSILWGPVDRIAQFVQSGGHMDRSVEVQLSNQDRKSLARYIEAHALENSTEEQAAKR